MKKRIEYFDIVRGICILLMIAGHIDFGSVAFDHYIHAFHMPIFFLLSGYFYHRSKSEKELVMKLFKKLIVPYFVCAILCFLFNSFLTGTITPQEFFNIFTTNNNGIPIAGALWFLTAFFWSNIIFSFLERRIKKPWLFYTISILFMFIGKYIFFLKGINLWWSGNAALIGVGLMAVGYYLKKKDLLEKCLISNKWILGIFFFFHMILIFLISYVNMRTNQYPLITYFLGNLLFSLVFYASLGKLLSKKESIILEDIKFLGRESIIPLCINQFVILLYTKTIYAWILPIWPSRFLLFLHILLCMISIYTILILTRVILKTKLKVIFGKN